MFELGFGDSLVGITDYCTQPKEAVETVTHIGGPKNPRIQDILALKPDLVLADWEENTRASVAELDAAGLAVWVTYPSTVRELMEILWTLSRLFKSQLAQSQAPNSGLDPGLDHFGIVRAPAGALFLPGLVSTKPAQPSAGG